MNNISAYKTTLTDTGTKKVRFLFESSGKKSIVKAIEYSPFKTDKGRTIYNLGFGDYNEEDGSFSDDINSNNGDMMKIFSTILSTVPLFFSSTKNAVLWVQGSDSIDNFREKCEPNCTKKCTTVCKNKGRRIRVYRHYVNKNFKELSKEYIFFGLPNDDTAGFVQYLPGDAYKSILIYRKK